MHKQQYTSFSILKLNKTVHVHLEIPKFISSLLRVFFSLEQSLQNRENISFGYQPIPPNFIFYIPCYYNIEFSYYYYGDNTIAK